LRNYGKKNTCNPVIEHFEAKTMKNRARKMEHRIISKKEIKPLFKNDVERLTELFRFGKCSHALDFESFPNQMSTVDLETRESDGR
jgi:hypothetical protein